MPRRFQFSLRDLLGLLTLAGVIAWGTALVGLTYVVIALFLVSPVIAGALLGKPLEGCLLTAFLLILVVFGGVVVAALLAD